MSNRPDPRLRIITKALCSLIPGAAPANITIRLEESVAGRTGCNTWDGGLAAVAKTIHTALHGRPAEQASPLAQAEEAKRRRDLGGELGALMDGQASMESAPWYPAQAGDILHIHCEAVSDMAAFGETFVVEDSAERGGLVLRLLTHTSEHDDTAGWFAPGVVDDPFMESWFEMGPAALTIVRHGRVVHGGGERG